MTLARLQPDYEAFISPSQNAYRNVRSNADVVFAKRILGNIVRNKVAELHILRIDLSRAFDTVDRVRLLSVMKNACPDPDVYRMVLALLTDTTLQVRVKQACGMKVTASIGSPQDDSLSPVLFNCYYEAAMKAIRPYFPPVTELGASRNMPRDTVC